MAYSLKYMFASLPRTTRGVPLVLGGDPKGENFLYTNGNSVFIRSVDDITCCDIYTEHSSPVNVAKYSPSRFYIASGDASGKIRIWDTVNKEHILKNEYQPLGKDIKDIAWSEDSKRIMVGGDGREKYSHVFLADTGSSNGSTTGHSKQVNSVDFKPNRPYRVVSVSEDYACIYYEGPPFKYTTCHRDHSNFAQSVRYAPDGSIFVTASSDGKMFMYDGKTGERKGELGNPAHKGGIYAISFHKDSRMLMSASGDKTIKVWDVTTGEVCKVFEVGTKAIEDMQLGCLWQNDTLISVSLSGYINYWSLKESGESQQTKVIKGHNKPITCMALSEDRTRLYTGCSDKVIMNWDISTGICESLKGNGHKNQVQSMAVCDGTLISCGMDDQLVFTNNDEYGASVKLDSMPKKLAAASGGLVVVACINDIAVYRGQNKVFSLKVEYGPLCVDIHPGLHEVAVGGESDQSLHIYSLSGDTLTEVKTFKHNGPIYDVKYSPDGARLAAVDGNRRITFYLTAEDYKQEMDTVAHSARVTCVAWSQNSEYAASGGLDTQITVYKMKGKKPLKIPVAHQQSQINGIAWTNENTIVSIGQDANVKFWSIDELPTA